MKHIMKRIVVASLVLPGAASVNADTLRDAIDTDYDYLEELFEHLHANPELSMQEFETAKRMATEMEQLGFEVTRKIGKTGLVGIMKNGDGPTLMIRADMDGLPVEENTELPYASRATQINLRGEEVPVMHACGHDVHMAVLVGTARRMVAMKNRWQGTLMLVAQPAEEAEGGAKAMVADGIYERTARPDFALAMHVIARHPAGKIAFSDGMMYSSADTVDITVRGIAAHGASPHKGRDPVYVASQIVIALQGIVSREVPPLEPAVITVGSFHAGSAPNVIADNAQLAVTVRANTETTRNLLLDSIERVAVQTARAAGVPDDLLPIVLVRPTGAPTTTNDRDLSRRVRAAMERGMDSGAFHEWHQVDMGAEDFPDLVNVDPPIPSVYFEVGGTLQAAIDDDSWASHHSPLFQIEPKPSITRGVEAMTLAALELLDDN